MAQRLGAGQFNCELLETDDQFGHLVYGHLDSGGQVVIDPLFDKHGELIGGLDVQSMLPIRVCILEVTSCAQDLRTIDPNVLSQFWVGAEAQQAWGDPNAAYPVVDWPVLKVLY